MRAVLSLASEGPVFPFIHLAKSTFARAAHPSGLAPLSIESSINEGSLASEDGFIQSLCSSTVCPAGIRIMSRGMEQLADSKAIPVLYVCCRFQALPFTAKRVCFPVKGLSLRNHPDSHLFPLL